MVLSDFVYIGASSRTSINEFIRLNEFTHGLWPIVAKDVQGHVLSQSSINLLGIQTLNHPRAAVSKRELGSRSFGIFFGGRGAKSWAFCQG